MPQFFSVSFLEDASKALEDIAYQSGFHSQRDRYITLLAQMLADLKIKPRDVGEPLFDLRTMRLKVRMLTVSPLSIVYGVHETEPVVIVKTIVNMQPFAD